MQNVLEKPQTPKEIGSIVWQAASDFEFFLTHIFPLSRDVFKNQTFVDGHHPRSIARWLGQNKKTLRVSAKDHFKSMSFYAHFMWQLLRTPDENLEAHYFSYEQGMAGYHVDKIKKAIACNPYFEDLKDMKSTAETVVKYSWDGTHTVTLEPHGLLAFKRGIHCPLVYVDDPLQDPANKMVLTNIRKINDIMKTQILDMTWDQLHIVGTAQTNEDFFFDDAFQKEFAYMRQPAIISDAEKKVLWPEWMNYDELQRRRLSRGPKLFDQEYLVVPALAADSFFKREQLIPLINPKLPNVSIMSRYAPKDKEGKEIKSDRLAGYDIGKKTHPSHFAVFEKRDGKRVQIHSKFMDHWDYTEQVAYIANAIEMLGIDYCWYDSTRGELDALKERGEIPAEMVPVPFTLKVKHAIATMFDRAVAEKKIQFLDDPRQLEQILAVTNDLKTIESPTGHGDSFWSIALSFMDMVEGEISIDFV